MDIEFQYTFNLTNIKNIIFDLGGVILNIDYDLSVKAFQNLGIQEFESLYSKTRQTNLFDALETGTISYADFRDEIRVIANKPLTNEQIDNAWNAMLLDLPIERINFLKKLKNKYRIFLLSNTNEGHFNCYTNYLQSTFNINGLDDLFENTYYSHAIGLSKPTPASFEYVIQKNKLLKTETLFIDDTIRHVEGARNVGLHGYHLQPDEDIITLFAKY